MTRPQAFKILPRRFRTALWGDRQKFGLVPIENDPDWRSWKQMSGEFYKSTQRSGVGLAVNDAGYRILKNTRLENLSVWKLAVGISVIYVTGQERRNSTS